MEISKQDKKKIKKLRKNIKYCISGLNEYIEQMHKDTRNDNIKIVLILVGVILLLAFIGNY